MRTEACRLMRVPEDGLVGFEQRVEDVNLAGRRLARQLTGRDKVRIEEGQLIVSPLEFAPRIRDLGDQILYRILPRSAPFAISILAISRLPLNSARDRAVNPCWSLTLMSAPLSINSLARSTWLNHAAYIRAVMPSLSLASISAPASSRRRTVSLWPLHTAFIKAVP